MADKVYSKKDEPYRGQYYDACVELMDDEIREKIHAALAPCSELEFLLAYCMAHREKYGEGFTVE